MTKKLIGAVFALALVLAACGDDSGGSSSDGERDEIISFLEDQGETPESAACFADELSDFPLSDFESIASAESESDVDPDFVEAVTAAARVCADTTGDSTPDDSTTTTTGE